MLPDLVLFLDPQLCGGYIRICGYEECDELDAKVKLLLGIVVRNWMDWRLV